MARNLFDVPIFFIVFRETVEAAIIVSVLLSFVEQLMTTGRFSAAAASDSSRFDGEVSTQLDALNSTPGEREDAQKRLKQLIRRMRIQIWAGTIAGFIIALAIGAAFIAVFYTKLTDLWSKTEEIWEGVFSIIACIIIYVMGVAFLKMDRSRVKWRLKLAAAFEKSQNSAIAHHAMEDGQLKGDDVKEGRQGKWALFLLPFITVMREGLEAVVFVGGVSLNATAAAIPIPVICGLAAGALVGYLIYRTGSTATLHWFLVGSTTVLFLIGAGLASKAVGYFQYYHFSNGVGSDVSETGDGPGSFQVAGNVWHLTYGNPETGSQSWGLFNAILGWNNTATLGSILTYVFYWLLIIVTLVYLKWKEGRVTFFGKSSAAAIRRQALKQARADAQDSPSGTAPLESPDDKSSYKPDVPETPRAELPVVSLRD